jgi:hypothetical protein
MPSEVRSLLAIVNFTALDGIYDLWSGTRTIEMVLYQERILVHSSDANPRSPAEHADALDVATYSARRSRPGGLQVIISSPDFRFVDLAIPLAVHAVGLVACFHVPGDYLSNAHPARMLYFLKLRTQNRLHVIQNLPKGPTGRSNMWVVIFQAGIDRNSLLHGDAPIMYASHKEFDGTLQYRAQVWSDLVAPQQQQGHTQRPRPRHHKTALRLRDA